MRGFPIVCAGLLTAIAVALAASGVTAQAATSEQVGEPLSLLAGLRPPHETRHVVHAKASHETLNRTASKRTHSKFARRTAAEHRRHLAAKKIAQQENGVRERSVAAAEPPVEPPAQSVPNPAPATVWPVADAASPADAAAAPTPATAPSNNDADPNAVVVNGQTVQVDSADQVNAMDLAADHDAPPVAAPSSNHADAVPATQTVLAAPVHRDASSIGSASWIAQVLAALGGAIAAGAVAWILIGSGPVRTYG